MRRRDFLLSSSATALLLCLPSSRRARAQASAERLWFVIDARGGWDPTCLIDPKGGEPFNEYFAEADIQSAGAIRWAPRDKQGSTLLGWDVGPTDDRRDFFSKYASELLVVQGIDTQTNSHDVGPRHTWSGNLREGSPSLPALLAAVREAELGTAMPMALLSTGGYDATSGLLPAARIGSTSAFIDLAEPWRHSPDNPANGNRFAHAVVEARIREAELARVGRLAARTTLSRAEQALARIAAARGTEVSFAPLVSELQAMRSLTASEDDHEAIPEAQVAIAAMRAGACVSAMISLGGFDTHDSHESPVDGQRVRAHRLLELVDYVVTELKAAGLYERAALVVGSDFGRTYYNQPPGTATRGKDHWPITSMMLLGAGIAGGRVVGATDRGDVESGDERLGHRALPVKVSGGELQVTTAQDPEGFILRPGHVHQALRALAGVGQHPLARRFPLVDARAATLPLLS